MSSISISKVNETYIRITSDDRGIEQQLSEFFTFEVPGARFTPAYKAKVWDGRLRLYNLQKKTLYAGLYDYVKKFAEINDVSIDDDLVSSSGAVTLSTVRDFIDGLQLTARGERLEVREYQYDAVYQALLNKRILLLSPTSSGKSSLIYSIIRYLLQHDPMARILIIVPVTNLVEQIYSDFEDYSSANQWPVSDFCQKIYGGQSKEITRRVIISTWQSIYKWSQADFVKLGITAVLVDESHLMKAQSLTSIMEKLTTTQYRIGLTGTLDGSKTNKLVIEGLTGPVYKVITTRQLMDDGYVSELKIKCILLEYSKEVRQAAKRLKYQDELEFVVTNQKRNKVIVDLARACSGNTLILFQFVDKHGKVLYNQLSDKLKDSSRSVYFISGDTAAKDREKIRKDIESDQDSIIIGSYQTVSTGINIPSLENVIFASPSKSRIRNLQSIGRGLRLKDGKSHCNLFDIADDLSHGKHVNYTLKHFMERIKIYSEESFDFKIHKIQLGE